MKFFKISIKDLETQNFVKFNVNPLTLVYTGSRSISDVKQAGLSEISSIIEVKGRWRRIFKNSTINLLFLHHRGQPALLRSSNGIQWY